MWLFGILLLTLNEAHVWHRVWTRETAVCQIAKVVGNDYDMFDVRNRSLERFLVVASTFNMGTFAFQMGTFAFQMKLKPDADFNMVYAVSCMQLENQVPCVTMKHRNQSSCVALVSANGPGNAQIDKICYLGASMSWKLTNNELQLNFTFSD